MGSMEPGVIECSPPNTRGNLLLAIIFLFICDNWFKACLIFFLIVNGFKVLIPIFLYGSLFNSSSNNSTW